MSITKRAAVIVAALALPVATAASCTPEQEAAVRAWLDESAATSTCHGAIDRLWPAGSRAWAHRIVERESHGIATAQNRTSTAAGCFQLLRLHAHRFTATGSSWAMRYDARANTLAALNLYRECGTGPWT